MVWIAGILFPSLAVGAGSQSYQSYSDNVSRTITSYGGPQYCVRSTTNHFIPNNTQSEWDAFYAKASAAQLSGLTAAAGACSQQQSWSTPGTYSWVVPAGVSCINVDVRGGGGASGGIDNMYVHTLGTNGDKVTATCISVTAGTTLSIYVGQGGQSPNGYPGGAGGTGHVNGATGYTGDFDAADDNYFAMGGSGGGGSSAIKYGSTLLTQAKGGDGGRGDDWDGYGDGWDYYSGGAGGLGGGTNSGGTTSVGGGAAAGPDWVWPNGEAGGNGSVTITY